MVFLKTFNSEFWLSNVWFTNQTSKPLKIEDEIKITLNFSSGAIYKNHIIQLTLKIEYLWKDIDFKKFK